MGNQVYSHAGYLIIKVSNSGFVVLNKRKDFKNGHTHIRSFKTAKYLIDLASRKTLPHHLSPYLLVSLMRITEDDMFKRKVEQLLFAKNDRRQKPVRRQTA